MRQSRHQLIALPATVLRVPPSALALACALLTTALLFASLFLTSAPASAHDAAESTAPANGSTVSAVPDKVSVTFSNKPLALGSQIQVNDSSGTNWAEGPVEIVDNVVSQKLKQGAPAGKFTVVWRVVSSDSHPIEGNFSFTASAGSGSTGSGTTTAGGSASAAPTAPVATAGTAQPSVAGQPGAVNQPGQETTSAAQPFPWSIVGFAAVALALLVFLGATARRKLAAGNGDAAAGDDAPGDESSEDAADEPAGDGPAKPTGDGPAKPAADGPAKP